MVGSIFAETGMEVCHADSPLSYVFIVDDAVMVLCCRQSTVSGSDYYRQSQAKFGQVLWRLFTYLQKTSLLDSIVQRRY